ncbi:MAG: hypothetical protein ACLQU5_06825 [Isosphaeraceae bacterium]
MSKQVRPTIPSEVQAGRRKRVAPPKTSGRFWARFHVISGRLVDVDLPITSDGWTLIRGRGIRHG